MRAQRLADMGALNRSRGVIRGGALVEQRGVTVAHLGNRQAHAVLQSQMLQRAPYSKGRSADAIHGDYLEELALDPGRAHQECGG